MSEVVVSERRAKYELAGEKRESRWYKEQGRICIATGSAERPKRSC